jgi:hypothetical protein
MGSEEQFDQLARRDAELSALASRGRRRSLSIMILAFVPISFVVMASNDDYSLASVIPLVVTFVGAISYSWAKWRRRPEDSQSVAFVGLDRKRQWATYRSLFRGSRIEDPVVLTIVESMHHHLRRSLAVVVATTVAIAVMGLVLVEVGSDGVSFWVPVAIVVLAGGAVAEHCWVVNRAGVVIDRSRR